ncbi:MAG TPA: Crp/Fnr family transcriptional regulator [Leucothrix sp.]|nr:Crp/Fnr family transcriptional regulator [Leucothrix sp.]
MPKETLIKKAVPLTTKLVKQSHLFSALSEPLLQEMTAHFSAERWEKHSYIDDIILNTRFFLLLEGRLEITRTHPESGRMITLDLLRPGDGFDIITLLDGQRHEVTLSPLEELKVISVPIEKMREWIWTYPELNQQLMPYLAQKMRDQEDKTTDFALYDTVTRLSRVILKNIDYIQSLATKSGGEHKEYLISGLSDEVLARMVGSVRQVVNQHLQDWKKKGIVDKKRNQIKINNLQDIIDSAGATGSRF